MLGYPYFLGNLHIHRFQVPGHRVDSAAHCDEAVQVEGAIHLATRGERFHEMGCGFLAMKKGG